MTRVVRLHSAKLGGLDFDYIGRAGKGYDGYFGNPHTTGGPCAVPSCVGVEHHRGSAVAAFRVYFYERIRVDAEYKRRVEELRGCVLACPGNCKPRPCHGDVFVEYLDGVSGGSGTLSP